MIVRRTFIKFISSLSILMVGTRLAPDNWKGYCVIHVDNTVPSAHIDAALSVVSLAGISVTTPFAHQKSVIRSNLTGSEYLWEITMKSNLPPDLDYITYGITNYTSLTASQVNSMIIDFEIIGNKEDAKNYIRGNVSEWESTNE